MKKSLILVGMLSIGYAYAQEGNVGINTDNPRATLEITPSTPNLTGTTNEGIIAPNLSKTRIANIATPIEGTLVYATDATYAGTNAKVSKITEKGYYFYNGTEWVKASAGADAELWKFTKEYDKTYPFITGRTDKAKDYSLVPSLFENEYLVKSTILNRTNEYEGKFITETLDKALKKVISGTEIGNGGIELYNLNESSTTLGYIDFKKSQDRDSDIRILGYDYLSDTDATNDDINKRLHISSVDAVNGNTFSFQLDGRRTTFSNPNVSYSFDKEHGFYFNPKTQVTSNDVGLYKYFDITKRTGIDNGSNISRMHIYLNRFLDTNGGWGGTTERIQRVVDVTKMGFIDFGIVSEKTNTAASYNGLGFGFNDKVHAVIRENGYMGLGTNEPSARLDVMGTIRVGGDRENVRTELTGGGIEIFRKDPNATTSRNIGHIDFKSEIGFDADIRLYGHKNIDDNKLFFRVQGSSDGTLSGATTKTPFNVDLTEGRIGINTATPTEALEVRGNIKTSSLAGTGDRVVYADANGVLKTGGSIAANNGLQNEATMACNDANRGKMNFVKDVTLAGGGKADAFAVCLKGSDGNHYWRYLYGAGGETTASGNFGTGLQ